MSRRRTLLPGHGSPMRPVLILLAVSFGLMLVIFPVIMHVAGVGIVGVIGVAILIVAVAVLLLAILRAMIGSYEDDRESMLAGETLATWRLSPDEHRRFLAQERRSTRRLAAAYAVGGAGLGVVLGVSADDWLLGGIMIGVFLCAATVILTLSGPPRAAGSAAGRDVLIGPRGVQVLGRYLPFHATLTHLRDVDLRPGDPAVLRLQVRTGRRIEEVRVPVPRDRVGEAEELVNHIRDAHEAQ